MKSLVLILVFSIVSVQFVTAKSISFKFQNSNTGDYIIPDKVILVDKNSGEEFIVNGNEVDFKSLVSVDDKDFQINESFYPNPTAGISEFTLNVKSSGTYLFSLCDVNGKELYKNNIELGVGSSSIVVNTFGLSAGTYFISITAEKFSQSVQFVVNSTSSSQTNVSIDAYQIQPSIVFDDSKIYDVKVCASGYEVYETEINSSDFIDNEVVMLELDDFDFSQFSIVESQLIMHLTSAYVEVFNYDEQGRPDGGSSYDIKDSIFVKEIQTAYLDSTNGPENQFRFVKNEETNKWKIHFDYTFKSTGVVKFYPLDFYIEDGKIEFHAESYDLTYRINDIVWRFEETYEDPWGHFSSRTVTSYDKMSISFNSNLEPPTSFTLSIR